ncbi:hypothetical protein SteCoe_18981 [Stentor coeruleus]|uniref:Arrestin-like N-terminal domain-containing protein n=1 Tax=Stentor coeruleus TaxID=5963 RepID=A0A1R2BV62_9CILI|nr:hypothetical protein SteCoe_18981 [Stentor coeruleus]
MNSSICLTNDYSIHKTLTLSGSFKLDIQEYSIKLKLQEKLNLPLCKGKYFRFQVKLYNKSNIPISRKEKFIFEAKLYTSSKPHREVTHSMNGKDILKGTTIVESSYDEKLNTHIGNFKLQINDVSSHFTGFNLLVNAHKNEYLEKTGLNVKPLLVKEILVMSKERICQKLRQNK